jgi:hypothetical protein
MLTLLSTDRHWSCLTVGQLPVPDLSKEAITSLTVNAKEIWGAFALLGKISETAKEYVGPILVIEEMRTVSNIERLALFEIERIQAKLMDAVQLLRQNDKILCEAASIDIEQLGSKLKAYEHSKAVENVEDMLIDSDQLLGRLGLSKRFLSYMFGCLVGTWDIRFTTDSRTPPETNPYESRQIARLCQLLGHSDVAPPSNHEKGRSRLFRLETTSYIPRDEAEYLNDDYFRGYPLRISWPGILVDDPGHAEDVVGRVRDALAVIWPENARRHRAGGVPDSGRAVAARLLWQSHPLLRRPSQALLQEPAPGADLLAAEHTVGMRTRCGFIITA